MLVYQHALPGVPGKSLKGVVVAYGPGGYSPAHTHAKLAIIYATVLEGDVAARSMMDPSRGTARASTGRNCLATIMASAPMRAIPMPPKLLAVFIVDDHETALTIPDAK